MNENEKTTEQNYEPVVLGYLKKEKSSKPAFVVIVFLFIIGICLGLPYIQEYLKNSNNFISDIYNKYFGDDDSGDKIIITNDTIHKLDAKSNIRYNNIFITNVSFNDGQITYYIKSNGDSVNLDEEALYLEIYGSTENLLKRVKLTGKTTNEATIRELKFSDFTFNTGAYYYGRMHALENNDYPVITATSLTCKFDNHEYIYSFENNALQKVDHNYYYAPGEDLSLYLNELTHYQNLANELNNIDGVSALVEEVNNRMEFKAEVVLNDLNLLGENINYNYYVLGKEAKIIKYEMEAKGFDCK